MICVSNCDSPDPSQRHLFEREPTPPSFSLRDAKRENKLTSASDFAPFLPSEQSPLCRVFACSWERCSVRHYHSTYRRGAMRNPASSLLVDPATDPPPASEPQV